MLYHMDILYESIPTIFEGYLTQGLKMFHAVNLVANSIRYLNNYHIQIQ